MELEFRGRTYKIPVVTQKFFANFEDHKENKEIEVIIEDKTIQEIGNHLIEQATEEELLEWAGPEHISDYLIKEYIEEAVEKMCLGLITKDEFIDGLLNIAEIKQNLIDVKNLK